MSRRNINLSGYKLLINLLLIKLPYSLEALPLEDTESFLPKGRSFERDLIRCMRLGDAASSTLGSGRNFIFVFLVSLYTIFSSLDLPLTPFECNDVGDCIEDFSVEIINKN